MKIHGGEMAAGSSARTLQRRAVAALGALAVAGLALSACAPDPAIEIPAPSQVEGQLPEPTLTELQTAVADAMAATGSSGAIVGVWVPWSGTWVTGVGTVSPTSETPVSTDMTFRIGDVTRAMTCDALYAAVDDELVALDDPVSDYVSGIPDIDVTLLELCNGTAGIGSYQARLQPLWLSNPTRAWNPRELAAYGLGQERTERGVAWRDSDASYVLLGLALERVTGKPASELLAEVVFEPLGLEHTTLPEGKGKWAGRSALSGNLTVKDAEGVMNCTEPLDMTPVSTTTGFTDSGVVSTIDDLGRYMQALAVGALAEEGSAAQDRWSDPKPVSSASWFTYTGGAFQAGSLIGQYGSVPGYLTGAFADPGTGLTVAVVLNNSAASSATPAYLAWELAAIASKAPAAAGQTAPEFGLPWTAEQYHEVIAKAAICPVPES
ncbi:serine hydrolase domain-containing protein [Microbacterium sp.]|uniref:serine hydrolase domain-containing protein n=1 Tax=Microbacterium sp. TaxID=51671 RepID=UPI0037C9F7B4